MSRTLVIQSHTSPLPAAWIASCLDSVERWAERSGFDYRFLGDEIFDTLDSASRDKTRDQLVVASDLARLLALRAALDEGYDAVVWCDADMLCFDAPRLVLPEDDFAVGREVWIQHKRRGSAALRAYVKVHNAFLVFRQGNAFLDFYLDAAARLLARHPGPFAPQILGPKFLTALHNIAPCPVVEEAGMLSPLVIADLARGHGPALTMFLARSPRPPAAANLCASLTCSGDLDSRLVERAIACLLTEAL